MLNYQIHRIETAPEKSKPLLELFTRAVGFVPNLAGAIANSPVLANSLLGLFQNVHAPMPCKCLGVTEIQRKLEGRFRSFSLAVPARVTGCCIDWKWVESN